MSTMLKKLADFEQEAPEEHVMKMAVHRAKLDPDWFCEEVLKCPNDPWQSELMNAVADLDRAKYGLPTQYNHELLTRFTVVAFHGPGKTHFMAKLAHWWNFTRKGRIAATAPKEKQLTTRLWPEFRKVRSGALEYYRKLIKVESTKITWAGDVDWCMLAEAASQPENLQGLHDDNMLFLVEEASGVNEEMFPPVEGALTTPGSVLVLIGNPTKASGEFHASHNKKGTMELYYKKAITPEDSPRIDKKWVAGMIRKYGEQSPVVQIRVFGKFVDADANQLMTLAWLEEAFDSEREPDGSLPKLRISADVADGGIDDSIITVAIHYLSFILLLKQYRFNFPSSVSPIEVGEAVKRIYEAHNGNPQNGDDVVIDSLGVGAGTAGWLIKEGVPTITYKGGESSDDPKQWRNRRTQSYMVCRDAFRDKTIIIHEDFLPDDELEEFYAQMCSIRSNPGTEKLEDLETKVQMKARGVKSPDRADSVAMQFATQAPVMPGSNQTPEAVGELASASYEGLTD